MVFGFQKRPRYGQKTRQECHGGCKDDGSRRWHDSIEEADYCNTLGLLKKAGEVRSYRSQVTYPLFSIDKTLCGSMRVDFEVIRADGRLVIHEYKGKLFATLMEYRTKKALFTHCYPTIEHITVRKGQRVL